MSDQKSDQKPVDSRSASQKISDLENALMALYQTANNMASDISTLKEAVKLLGNKVDSIVKASTKGEQITDAVISRIMIENNVEDLTNKVKNMIAQGILAVQEQVSNDSFIVGEETNDQGDIVNPRLQFALMAVQPELREKFVGAKAGDLLTLQEGKLKFRLLETYQIQQPKPQGQPAEASAAEPTVAEASASAPEAAPAAPEATPAPGSNCVMDSLAEEAPAVETAPAAETKTE